MFGKWPPLRAESDKFLHFDTLRILGAIVVALVHWSSEMVISPDWTDVVNRSAHLGPMVDMFFLLSGFIVCHLYAERMHGWRDYADFMQKRFARLGPLHWATLAFFVAIGATAPLINYQLAHPENYDFQCLGPNLVFAQSYGVCDSLTFNFPSWTVSAEMMCYLLLPLYLVGYRVSVWLPGALGLAMVIGMTLLGPTAFGGHDWWDLTWNLGVLRALPAFGIGVTLYGIRHHLARVPFAGETMYVIFFATIVGALVGASQGFLMVLIYGAAFFAAAADMRGESGQATTLLARLSPLSYSVYLLHVPFEVIVFTVGFKKMLHVPPEFINVAMVASLPLLLFVSYLSLAIFETPARRWISGLGKPSRGQAVHLPVAVDTGYA